MGTAPEASDRIMADGAQAVAGASNEGHVVVSITVNGRAVSAAVEARTLLVEFIRQVAGQTGTHVGCDTTQCGACTVNLDGAAVKSCTVLAAQADGGAVTTVEGLVRETVDGPTMHPVQEAFVQCHGLQCGFCTPGMVMNIERFLAGPSPKLDEASICHALEGNICRCTGYVNIIASVRHAARAMGLDVPEAHA